MKLRPYRLDKEHAAAKCPFFAQGQHCPKIMKPPQSLPLHMAERLLRAQPVSVANHIKARRPLIERAQRAVT